MDLKSTTLAKVKFLYYIAGQRVIYMDLFKELQKDIRFNDGLNACINCGVCSAICPAAQFCDYDPRGIVNAVQGGDNDLIESLLTGNAIWYCGECFSCNEFLELDRRISISIGKVTAYVLSKDIPLIPIPFVSALNT